MEWGSVNESFRAYGIWNSSILKEGTDFREDIAHRNHDDDKVWQVVIRRMEILSLIFYVGVLFVTIYLFFYHDWYCAIGINPCGRQNRKCPWLEKLAEDPTCQHNSYN